MIVPPWIVEPGARILTPNRYHRGYKPDRVAPIECVVLHYTAGRDYLGTARYLANKLATPAQASAHFVIGRGGEVVQLAPLTDRTWHAGGRASRWRGRPVNPVSIGIEIANLGPLTEAGDGFLDYYGKAYTGPPPFRGRGKWWEPYTEPQLEAVDRIVDTVAAIFPVLQRNDGGSGVARVCSHEEVDPSRKTDTGPAFPLQRIRERVCRL